MSSSEQAGQPSPWISVWLKPGDTIERILAERPRRGALLLGSVGLMSGSVSQLVGLIASITSNAWLVCPVTAFG